MEASFLPVVWTFTRVRAVEGRKPVRGHTPYRMFFATSADIAPSVLNEDIRAEDFAPSVIALAGGVQEETDGAINTSIAARQLLSRSSAHRHFGF